MNSDACLKPNLGTFKSMSSPMSSGAGKEREAYCFTASICLLRMRGRLAISVASAQRPQAKGEEATHSPRSFETKGLCKLLSHSNA